MNPQLFTKFKPPMISKDGPKTMFRTPFQALQSASLLTITRKQEKLIEKNNKYESSIDYSDEKNIYTREVTPASKLDGEINKENTIGKTYNDIKNISESLKIEYKKESDEIISNEIKEIDSQIERLELIAEIQKKQAQEIEKNKGSSGDNDTNLKENKKNTVIEEKTLSEMPKIKERENSLGNHIEDQEKSEIYSKNSSSVGIKSEENKNKKLFKPPAVLSSRVFSENPLQTAQPISDPGIKHDELYYEVIYTNKQRKKGFSDDGILVLTIKKFTLLDSKGKQLSESPNMLKVRSLCDGYKLSIGLREIEIIKKIRRDDYISGRCFIQENSIKEITEIPAFVPTEVAIPEGSYILDEKIKVYIEPFLTQKLRPHQKEGVQFMYDCVSGKKVPSHFGCILADSMGLGKTLQAITLLYTLLRKDAQYFSFAKKGIIVAPATLVDNWKEEIIKWLGPIRLTPIVCSGTGKQKKNFLNIFEKGPSSLLIISYDTFVKHAETLGKVCQIC